jgi:hypothetical protein
MDQIPLVNEQIEDGRKVVQRLTESDIPITAAGWVKESDRGQWYLYLVTPLVGEVGATTPAYRRIRGRGLHLPTADRGRAVDDPGRWVRGDGRRRSSTPALFQSRNTHAQPLPHSSPQGMVWEN